MNLSEDSKCLYESMRKAIRNCYIVCKSNRDMDRLESMIALLMSNERSSQSMFLEFMKNNPKEPQNDHVGD